MGFHAPDTGAARERETMKDAAIRREGSLWEYKAEQMMKRLTYSLH